MKKKTIKIGLITIISIVIIACAGFYIYTLDYYRATVDVEEYEVTQEDFLTVFTPKEPNGAGLIFYPGGKVDETAYYPILKELSDKGITCVLIKMPFHLAVFGMNRADAVLQEPIFDDVNDWYIGGHSLGGAMASSYLEGNAEAFSGLILLGAYPVNDIDISTIAIYGSEDGVLNRDKLDGTENQIVIEGGNHAYFGNYGEQDGDGTATITREEQQKQCVEKIIEFTEQTSY